MLQLLKIFTLKYQCAWQTNVRAPPKSNTFQNVASSNHPSWLSTEEATEQESSVDFIRRGISFKSATIVTDHECRSRIISQRSARRAPRCGEKKLPPRNITSLIMEAILFFVMLRKGNAKYTADTTSFYFSKEKLSLES